MSQLFPFLSPFIIDAMRALAMVESDDKDNEASQLSREKSGDSLAGKDWVSVVNKIGFATDWMYWFCQPILGVLSYSPGIVCRLLLIWVFPFGLLVAGVLLL